MAMNCILSQLNNIASTDRIIVRDAKNALSGSVVFARCQQLAELLKQPQLSRIALYGDNSINWMIADLACQMANICLIPLPTFFTTQQIKHVLESTPVDGILCEKACLLPSLFGSHVIAELKTPLSEYSLLLMEAKHSTAQLPPGTHKITFTSGSTGQPKGVCLSNEQLWLQAQALADITALKQPRHLCLLPLSTLLENVAGIYCTLLAEGEVMLPSLQDIGFEGSSSLNTQQFTDTISTYSPHSMILTPQLLQVLVAAAQAGWQPPESLTFVAVGGARVSPRLLALAHAHNIPAYEGYGLSECASVVSLNTPRNNGQQSCGQPLPHLSLSFENGELLVKGNAMLGYANEPESWEQTTIATGDLGYRNAAGHLVITGRKKNLLISSYGRNINPEWVESELQLNPEISECVVFGDARPYCIALISLRTEISDQALQRIIDKTNSQLPDYARIQGWHRLSTPLSAEADLTTSNGRPRREAIAKHFSQHIESLYPHQLKVHCQ